MVIIINMSYFDKYILNKNKYLLYKNQYGSGGKYEGDIVNFDDSFIAESNYSSKGIAEVVYTTDMTLYQSPCFALFFYKPKSGFGMSMLGDIEVIGNIFENSELLK